MLERPTNLISAAEMQKRDALIELAKPKHSEFSRYFPRIRGTPQKFKGPKRARAKVQQIYPDGFGIPSIYADVMKGLENFFGWADHVTTNMVKNGEKDAEQNPWKLQEPSSRILGVQLHFLFGKFCDMTGTRGREKAAMRRLLDREIVKLKKEFVEFENNKLEELSS
jgi:hypothetical protein